MTKEQLDALLSYIDAAIDTKIEDHARRDSGNEWLKQNELRHELFASFGMCEDGMPLATEEKPAHVGKWVAKLRPVHGAVAYYGVYNPILDKWYENADAKPYWWADHRMAVQEAKRLNAVAQ